MRDGEFEWDDAKAAANLARHGVSIGDARLAFADAFAVESEDLRKDYGGERRYICNRNNHQAITDSNHQAYASFSKITIRSQSFIRAGVAFNLCPVRRLRSTIFDSNTGHATNTCSVWGY